MGVGLWINSTHLPLSNESAHFLRTSCVCNRNQRLSPAFTAMVVLAVNQGAYNSTADLYFYPSTALLLLSLMSNQSSWCWFSGNLHAQSLESKHLSM